MKYMLNKVFNRIKREITYVYLSLWVALYYNRVFVPDHMKEPPSRDFCDLIVISFNNAEVIEYQIKTLSRFFKCPYRYTVFDNSTNEKYSVSINQICKKNNIGFIRLPNQNFIPKGWGSYSHGIAINFVINKYIKNKGAKIVGILDHDIFLVKDFDILKYMNNQPFYGVKHRFYLWPGLWFCKMDYLKYKKVDFRPSIRLRGDTGASNAHSLFKGVDFSKYSLAHDEHKFFEGDDIFDYGYSYFDSGWIHCWNASNYMGKENLNKKMKLIFQMLDSILAE